MIDFSEESRFERKFFIGNGILGEVEHFVKINPAFFSESFPERRVNNIYLDSIDVDDYLENIEGVSPRSKIRIRWYGSFFGKIKEPVLELKFKDADVYKKFSFPLRDFVIDRNFSLSYLWKEALEKSGLPKWLVENIRAKEITLLNSYKRKYFTSADKRHRITLDNDLMFFDSGRGDKLFAKKNRDRETVILEIKYSRKDEAGAAKIGQSLPFRMTKSSKYILGIDSLWN